MSTIDDLIARVQALTGPRVIVALAGPPASGKSTLAEEIAEKTGGAVLPMDGFHLDDSILEPRGLLPRKGAPETFDLCGFARTVAALHDGGDVYHPVFDRSREIAIAGAGFIPAATRVVVVEGNWLLLDAPGWRDIRYDLTARLDVPEDELRRRLEQRWHRMTPEARAAKIDGNDLPNARLMREGSRKPDVVLG